MSISRSIQAIAFMLAWAVLFTVKSYAQSPSQNFNGPVGIGIGTATPKGAFHVGGGQYMMGHVMYHAFEGDGASGSAFIQARDNSNTSTINMIFRTQLNGAYTEAMRIFGNGDVQVGANPNSYFNIYPAKYHNGTSIVSDPMSVAIDLPGTKRITFSDNIHLMDGSMGIGTLNAWDIFTVKGAVRIGSSFESDYLRLYHTPTRGYIEAFEDDEGMFFKSNKAKMFTFNGYNLNIKPEAMTGQTSQITFSDPDNGTAPMSINFKDDGSADLSIMGGKLGVNTVDPTEMLDVTGNIKATILKVDKIALSATNSNTTYGYNAGAAFTGSNLGNVAIGKGSASGVNNANYSVFLGYNAGSDFSHVTFEGGVNPLTSGKSVFVVNNQAQLHNPLLFGTFVDNTDKNDGNHHTVSGSMAQLGINTHHLVDSAALTVAGAVHIGSKELDPASFPRDSLYKDFLLFVEQGILSENFAFGAVDRWSDFVFDDDYKLSPLSDVEDYIRTNNHLPAIPSEAHIKKHGYDQHGMNTLFLQKIEELTLYAIDLEKKLKAHSDLAERIKNLEALLERK